MEEGVAEISDVFFVDGVRTPFGRAGEKGMYWNTRADDLAVKATIGLMERNASVPAATACSMFSSSLYIGMTRETDGRAMRRE